MTAPSQAQLPKKYRKSSVCDLFPGHDPLSPPPPKLLDSLTNKCIVAGIEIPESGLVNLTELALSPLTSALDEKLSPSVYITPGGSDEYMPIFLHEKRVPRTSLDEWTGKLTGLREDGEKITLKLVELKDLWKEGGRDAKTLAAWALYQGLKAERKI